MPYKLIYNSYSEFIRDKNTSLLPVCISKRKKKGMNKYFVLLKTDATRTKDITQTLRKLPEQPYHGVRLYYTMNCFGNWDLAIWFEAENNNSANEWVEKKIRPIPGVLEAYTVPTTPIKEYVNWK